MKKVILAFLVLTVLVTGPAVWVSASGTGHHHHREAASPFDEDKSQRKSLHCLLNRHRQGFFCPHKGLLSPKNQSQGAAIAVHCGGNPNSIPAALNLTQELSPAMPTIFQVFRFNESIRFNTIVPAIHKFHLLDVQYPPPRFI